MVQPDVNDRHRRSLSKSLGLAAMAGATSAALITGLVLPAVAHAQPAPPPPPPPTVVEEVAPPPVDPNAPPPPPPADPNAPPPPPADPNAPPPPPGPDPGRVDNAAGGFSYVVPAGWKVADDATQLSYGQALLSKLPPADALPDAPPPNDTSVLLGRLDLKLFAGAETDNTKAAQRLASDMGEFFMPFPGTRVNQQTVDLNAGGMTGVASSYEVDFTDTTKPSGQIWAGVVGEPTPAGTPRGQRAPERWFVVWLGTAENPIPQEEAAILANSIRQWTPPPALDPNAPPPPPDPNAPPPDPNAPPPPPAVGVPVPIDPSDAPGMLPPA